MPAYFGPAGGSSSGGGGIASINADTTSAQVIAATAPITANTAAGTTTIASTAASGAAAGHITLGAQILGTGVKTMAGVISTTRVLSAVVQLSDSATANIDASLGNTFRISATQNTAFAAPTNPISGQTIIIEFYAVSAPRTPTLATSAGGFAASNGISTTLPAVPQNTFFLLVAHYSATNAKWNLIGYDDGYA